MKLKFAKCGASNYEKETANYELRSPAYDAAKGRLTFTFLPCKHIKRTNVQKKIAIPKKVKGLRS